MCCVSLLFASLAGKMQAFQIMRGESRVPLPAVYIVSSFSNFLSAGGDEQPSRIEIISSRGSGFGSDQRSGRWKCNLHP